MKRDWLILALVIIALIPRPLFAGSNEGVDNKQASTHMLSVGPCINYMFYKELFTVEDLLNEEASEIDSIIGTPKSTEYGLSAGIDFSYTYTNPNRPMFFRPKFSFIYGMLNTYDGASQLTMDLSDSVTAVNYQPISFKKDNYFLQTGFDAGCVFSSEVSRLTLSAGLDARLWIREFIEGGMMFSENENYTDREYYYWFTFPIDVCVSRIVNSQWTIGINGIFNLMFFGQMKYLSTASDYYGNTLKLSGTPVTLRNRPGARFELFAEKRINNFLGVRVSPYFEFYLFGKSNIGELSYKINGETIEEGGSFYEPSSKSFWGGVVVNVLLFPGNGSSQ